MKIVIVDDDRLVAMSLKTIVESDPDIEVAATGYSGNDVIALFNQFHPDVLLTDIRMDGMTGLEAGEKILSEVKDAKILYLTTFNDDEYIIKALSIGARGYIIKQDFDSVIPALKAVYGGQSVFGNEVTDRLPDILSKNAVTDTENNASYKRKDYTSLDLSEQDVSIIECVAEGLSNKEISERLFLSEGTVRNYISAILSKLGLRDRTNLAIYYYKTFR